MTNKEMMLSTKSNPYNPFKDFDNWFRYDEVIDPLHACRTLSRYAMVSDEASELDNFQAISQAINYILENDATKQFIVVYNE